MKSDTVFLPERVLAIGAHPDDIDFGASGSIAAWTTKGAHVEYLVITDGSKGSDDMTMTPQQLIEQRQAEQQAAAKTLGVSEVHFLNYEDGTLENTLALKKDIVRLIREVRPDTVIVLDPTMIYVAELHFVNHPDHRAAGQATLDAVFPLARDHLSFPELYEAGLQPHKVTRLLLVNLERQNFYVDISHTFQTKLTALLQHASQVPDPEALRAMLQDRAEGFGGKAGCRYAEAFMKLDLPQ